MMVEDLDDLGLLDARDALGTLCVIDQQDPPRRRADEVRPGHQADRPTAAVNRNGRPIVDVLDLIGDVGDEVLAGDSQRVTLDQGVAWLRERDHPAGDVAVERRRDNRRPAGSG
jgi:hypothetical protein